MRGRLIYLAGLDGSGKTTQAERFVRSPEGENGRWVYRWVRWEPFLTGPLMALARRLLPGGRRRGGERPRDDAGYEDFTQGKQKLFRRRWLRELWTLAVLLEYLPQAWWRAGPPLIRGRRVLCDRYLPDLWVDLAMNFGEGADGVRRLARHPVGRLFPPVAHMVFLDVTPETGFNRKQDGTPLRYLEDRRPLYLVVGEVLGARSVDANGNPEEVFAAVRSTLKTLGG